MLIDTNTVSVRDLSADEIPYILSYWFDSPKEYLLGLGVDLNKMPTREQMKENLEKRISDNLKRPESKISTQIITYNNQPIGLHTINPLIEGDHGIFHAHIWDKNFRGKGVGLISYPKACAVFMKRFDLKKILFKTPKQNIGAIRVKQKLGIRRIGEEIIGFSIIKEGTLAQVFELTRDEINNTKF